MIYKKDKDKMSSKAINNFTLVPKKRRSVKSNVSQKGLILQVRPHFRNQTVENKHTEESCNEDSFKRSSDFFRGIKKPSPMYFDKNKSEMRLKNGKMNLQIGKVKPNSKEKQKKMQIFWEHHSNHEQGRLNFLVFNKEISKEFINQHQIIMFIII